MNPALGAGDCLGTVDRASVLFSTDTGQVSIFRSDEAPEDADTVISGSGLVGLPGLVECHSHLVYGGSRSNEFRERLGGVSYLEILERGGGIVNTVQNTRAATADELYLTAQQRVDGFVRHGVTTVEVKSGYGLNIDTEYKMLEVARRCEGKARIVTTFLGAHTFPPELKNDRRKYVDQVITEQLPKCAPLSEAIDIFCDKGAFTLEEAQEILSAGQKMGLKVKAHAEQIEYSGCAQLVADMKGISADHLERLDESGAEAMGRAGVVAVMLPGAQFYLKDTSPPTSLLRTHNVKMAVATDLNPGSSPCHDLLQMATMSTIIQGLTVEEAILGVTKHAGLALGRENLGWLGSGSVQDLCLYRPAPGEPAKVESLIQHMGANECVLTVRDGQIVWNEQQGRRT